MSVRNTSNVLLVIDCVSRSTALLPRRASPTATSAPISPPASPIPAASAMNSSNTSRDRAPSAFKTPISLVRSSTAVYMVFAMPRHARSSAMRARPNSATRSLPSRSSKFRNWSPNVWDWNPRASTR